MAQDSTKKPNEPDAVAVTLLLNESVFSLVPFLVLSVRSLRIRPQTRCKHISKETLLCRNSTPSPLPPNTGCSEETVAFQKPIQVSGIFQDRIYWSESLSCELQKPTAFCQGKIHNYGSSPVMNHKGALSSTSAPAEETLHSYMYGNMTVLKHHTAVCQQDCAFVRGPNRLLVSKCI